MIATSAPPAPPQAPSVPQRSGYDIKRAKRGKFCRACSLKIHAGDRYALIDAWTWMHIGCIEAQS